MGDKDYCFRVSISDQKTKGHEWYTLKVKDTGIALCDVVTDDVILEWPYTQIRRYSRSQTKLTLEAGRMSESGEGYFAMDTPDGRDILDRIHEKTQQLHEKKHKETKWKSKSLPPLPPPDEDYTEPYNWIPSSHERKFQRSHTCSPRSSPVLHSRKHLRGHMYMNQSRSVDKEEVVIDRGCVRIEETQRHREHSEERYTPMTPRCRDGHSYMGMTSPTSDSSYITPIHGNDHS